MNSLEVCELTKRYSPDGPPAVDGATFSLGKGEILALVGPSGCGKTTILRLIAGFERPDAGAVALNGRVVANHRAWVPPEKRGVGMVFQDVALFPHLTVAGNVAFGLAGWDRRIAASNTRHVLKLVGLERLAERYPHQLSGGEQQRVALARALAPRPVVILLDEPFSNLDADRRARMREEVRVILKTAGATAIFVTHDQEEALFMGDRVAVLRAGRIEQVGKPEEVFQQPATRFVAEFMGATDFLPGTATSDGVLTELGLIAQSVNAPAGTTVEVALRADDVQIVPDVSAKARVLSCQFKGAVNLFRVRLPSGRLIHSLQSHTLSLPAGTPVRVRVAPGHPLACFADGKAV